MFFEDITAREKKKGRNTKIQQFGIVISNSQYSSNLEMKKIYIDSLTKI
jgi:hypothetical protein